MRKMEFKEREFKKSGFKGIEFKKAEGYFTVEASLVMPLVIFLIGFIFYLTFYLYNRCAIAQDTYVLAFRGSLCSNLCCEKSPEEVKQFIIGKSTGQFGKKYMGISSLDNSVKVDKRKISVEASGVLTAAFTGQLGLGNKWRFGGNGQAERICPTECIRKVRLLKKGMDLVEGWTNTKKDNGEAAE